MKRYFQLFTIILLCNLTFDAQASNCEQHALKSCPDIAELLEERKGSHAYSAITESRVTGGLNGEVYYVTNLNNDGPGSLRFAAENPDPLWIKFAVEGEIHLEKAIRVNSNKTIDGRDHNITIKNWGFKLYGVENVIINDLDIRDGLGDGKIVTSDGVNVKNGSKKIWLHHLEISNMSDGLIDVTRGCDLITISYGKFYNHDKGMIMGLQEKHADESKQRISIHHNWFKNINQRTPRVAQSKVHFYNNYVSSWGSYMISSSEGGQILAESNVFNPESASKSPVIRYDLDTYPGCALLLNNLALKRLKNANSRDAHKVFDPLNHYEYHPEKATRLLMLQLMVKTGPR